jgi:hypothetical protein
VNVPGKTPAERDAEKRDIMAHYGGALCTGCGETEIAVLDICSVNECHRLNYDTLYTYLRNASFPPGYRVLCANCNVKASCGIRLPGPPRDYGYLLRIALWYVNDFWTTTTDAGHRAKAWEHMQEIEKAADSR